MLILCEQCTVWIIVLRDALSVCCGCRREVAAVQRHQPPTSHAQRPVASFFYFAFDSATGDHITIAPVYSPLLKTLPRTKRLPAGEHSCCVVHHVVTVFNHEDLQSCADSRACHACAWQLDLRQCFIRNASRDRWSCRRRKYALADCHRNSEWFPWSRIATHYNNSRAAPGRSQHGKVLLHNAGCQDTFRSAVLTSDRPLDDSSRRPCLSRNWAQPCFQRISNTGGRYCFVLPWQLGGLGPEQVFLQMEYSCRKRCSGYFPD